MNRREFLKRVGVGAAAIAVLDPKMLEEAVTASPKGFNPTTTVFEPSGKVTVATYSEILRDYYLPPIQEVLNDPGKLHHFDGKKVVIPMHFSRAHEFGHAEFELGD